ncbi:MAG: hypothetical protein WC455_10290 [Dehalococcoidia bacterium]|jgi:hypothetical protein
MEKNIRKSYRPDEFKKRWHANEYAFRLREFVAIDMKTREANIEVPFVSRGIDTSLDWITFESASFTNSLTGNSVPVKAPNKKQPAKPLGHEIIFKVSKRLAEKVGKEGLDAMREEAKKFGDAENALTVKGLKTQSKALANETKLRLKEIAAVAGGYEDYLELGKVAKFFKYVKDGKIGICEYGEYLRDVPDDVYSAKVEAEPFFDGFVIMHCTSEKEAIKAGATQDQAQRSVGKKDPILFGVHDGSDRMWFIADWIDEKCDLTWSELVKGIAEGERVERKESKSKEGLATRLRRVIGL